MEFSQIFELWWLNDMSLPVSDVLILGSQWWHTVGGLKMWLCWRRYAYGSGFESLKTSDIPIMLSLLSSCSSRCELSAFGPWWHACCLLPAATIPCHDWFLIPSWNCTLEQTFHTIRFLFKVLYHSSRRVTNIED